MKFELLGWPDDGPTLQLSHEAFAYAGKFVMSSTGKAVVRPSDVAETDVLGAAAFNADRTDESRLWVRYVTVQEGHRGEGIGPRLLRFVAERALDHGYRDVRIAVNNPFAYEASYRAGFVFTGDESGLAELDLVYDPDCSRSVERYQNGFDRYRARDLSAVEETFLDGYVEATPPDTVPVPSLQ